MVHPRVEDLPCYGFPVTEPRGRGRPPKPEGAKVALNLRVPQELKDEANRIAHARGENLSAVVEAALRRYVARHRKREDPLPSNKA